MQVNEHVLTSPVHVRRILARIRTVKAGHVDWVKLNQTIEAVMQIVGLARQFLSERSGLTASSLTRDSVLRRAASLHHSDLTFINKVLGTLIDWEETALHKQVTVRDGKVYNWCLAYVCWYVSSAQELTRAWIAGGESTHP